MEFFTTNLAPIMFGGLILFLLMGFPVAFSLGACGLFFAFIGIELGVLPEALLQALPLRIFGIMQNDTLLAIPFFTLMGLILERSGMAEDLLDTIGQLFGPIRGGLALAVIFVGTLLAATTGVVAASDMGRHFGRASFCPAIAVHHHGSGLAVYGPRGHAGHCGHFLWHQARCDGACGTGSLPSGLQVAQEQLALGHCGRCVHGHLCAECSVSAHCGGGCCGRLPRRQAAAAASPSGSGL